MKDLTKAEKDEEADIKKIIYSFEPLLEKAKNRDALKATPRFRRFRRRWRRLRRSVRRRWRRARRSIRDSTQKKKMAQDFNYISESQSKIFPFHFLGGDGVGRGGPSGGGGTGSGEE